MRRAPLSWVIDPDDPRAPPQEIWDQLSPDERRHLLDALPSDRPRGTRTSTPRWLPKTCSGATSSASAEKRAEDEKRRADASEVRLAEALAEIERLKRERG